MEAAATGPEGEGNHDDNDDRPSPAVPSTNSTKYYCHHCQQEIAPVPSKRVPRDSELVCPICHGEFIEIISAETPPPSAESSHATGPVPAAAWIPFELFSGAPFVAGSPSPNVRVSVQIGRIVPQGDPAPGTSRFIFQQPLPTSAPPSLSESTQAADLATNLGNAMPFVEQLLNLPLFQQGQGTDAAHRRRRDAPGDNIEQGLRTDSTPRLDADNSRPSYRVPESSGAATTSASQEPTQSPPQSIMQYVLDNCLKPLLIRFRIIREFLAHPERYMASSRTGQAHELPMFGAVFRLPETLGDYALGDNAFDNIISQLLEQESL